MEWNILLNENVKWNGINGTIISIDENYITIETEDGKLHKSCAPTSDSVDIKQLKNIYVRCVKFNNDIQTQILSYIDQRINEAIRLKEEEQRLKDEEEARLLAEGKLQQKIKNKQQYISNKQKLFEHKRNTEPYPTWLVFQGKSYKKEFENQYLFVADTFDRSLPYWTTIEELKLDNVILHCRHQFIYAISQVVITCHEWIDDEAGKGQRVDCDYIMLENPVDLNNYRETIINYNQSYMSPFNKNGKGNQGYLFPLDFDLAKFFIKEATKNNKFLLKYDYIQKIV